MDKQAYFKMMGLDKQAAIDPQVLKNILLGAGAGLGTYALSSFLPGARQNRLARLLASLGVGLGTGYFGTDIRNWFSNRSGKKQDTSDPTIEQENAEAQQLAMQQAEREQLERQQKPAAPTVSSADAQAATQKLKTPPVIPSGKTTAQVANQMQAAGRLAAGAKSQPVEPIKAPEMKLEQKLAEKPDKGDKIQAPNMTISGKPDKKDQAKMERQQTPAAPAAAAPTKDPYQAEIDQQVAAGMRELQRAKALNPIRYMNASPEKVRQYLYKGYKADRDAYLSARGYPYKINPISLGRQVYMQDFYPEADKDKLEALYGPLPRGVLEYMDDVWGRN